MLWYFRKHGSIHLDRLEWISVLRLAKLWSFHRIVAIAVENIKKEVVNAIELYELGITYDIDDFTYPAIIDLVTRGSVLSAEDASRLGFGFAYKLFTAREQVLKAESDESTIHIISSVFSLQHATVQQFYRLRTQSASGNNMAIAVYDAPGNVFHS